MLSIAGSDSGGGAGIQADLKAFAACGVHGMTAITAITAQSTVGVDAVGAVDPEMIVAQVRAVQRDIGVDAVKIGMLGTVETIAAVERALDELDPATPIVLDPVMVAESGAELLAQEARAALVERLLPRVTVMTPNLPEARAIAGGEGLRGRGESRGSTRPRSRARSMRSGPRCVVVTGGHREQAVDVFFDGERSSRSPASASRRRRARLRLHALLRAGGTPRARLHAAGGGARREGARGRRRARRPARRSAAAPARSTCSASAGARPRPRPSGT